ncbi:MAG: diguanylate cyclase [Pseudonocardiaceae bacterium]|nr:diguanylate cyclase [Pseudonocardiaceae bacterium]
MASTETAVSHDDPPRSSALSEQDHRVRSLADAGRLAEANTLFDDLVSSTPGELDPQARAEVIAFRSLAAYRLGRISLALELAAEAWAHLDDCADESSGMAQTLNTLSVLLYRIGNRRGSISVQRRAVKAARDSGNVELLARCLQGLGGTLNFDALDGPETDRPATFQATKLILEEGLGLLTQGRVYDALLAAYARTLAGLGDLDEAERTARRVLRLGERADNHWNLAVGNWVLAVINRARGELRAARRLATRSVYEAELINDVSLVERMATDLANICAALNDAPGEAAALRRNLLAQRAMLQTLHEGLSQALDQQRLAIRAQRMATAAREAAERDTLTGLTNRLGLERTAPDLLARASAEGRVAHLVLIDVDWFKGVNDVAGHAAGDAALREIAQLLRQECRQDDLVARWAGDEFVIILTDRPEPLPATSGGKQPDLGLSVAERIRIAVAEHDWSAGLGTARRPTLSIGVASHADRLDTLFALADIALYEAKRSGRNQTREYSGSVNR